MPDDLATFDDSVLIGQRDQLLDVFINHQNALPGSPQPRKASPDFLAHQRCQSLSRLIENQQARVGDQGATDCEHLLFTAGELVAEVF